jgi:hypothetical protein
MPQIKNATQSNYGLKSLLLAFSAGILIASAYWRFAVPSTPKDAIPSAPPNATPAPADPAAPLLTSSVNAKGMVLVHTKLDRPNLKVKAWVMTIHSADGVLVKSLVGNDRQTLPKEISLGRQSVAEGWTYDLSLITENGLENNHGALAKTLKPKAVELAPVRLDSKAKLAKTVSLLKVTQPDPALHNKNEAFSISVTLAKRSHLVVDIFDASDRRLKRLFEGDLDAGHADFSFDGYDAEGTPALPGRYRVVADWDGKIEEKWVTLQ